MSNLESMAMELLALYLATPRRSRGRRDELADRLATIGRRDPQALGRALYAAGFRAEDLAGGDDR